MLKLILAVGGNGDNRKAGEVTGAGAGAGAGAGKIVIGPIGRIGPIVGLIKKSAALAPALPPASCLPPILLTNRISCVMIRALTSTLLTETLL